MKRPRVIGTTLENIARFEASIGYALPSSLRRWLVLHNGSRDVFAVPDEREPRTLTGNMLQEREQLESYVSDCFDRDPSTVAYLLPIASVGDGDVWCLDLEASSDPDGDRPVVRWSHETGEVTRVASGFDEFIALRDANALE